MTALVIPLTSKKHREQHEPGKASDPWRAIDPNNVSEDQRRFLRYLIRRFRGDRAELEKFYFRGYKGQILPIIARLGLLPYYNGVRLIFGRTTRVHVENYPIYVHKFRDNGVDELELTPLHSMTWREFREEFEDE